MRADIGARRAGISPLMVDRSPLPDAAPTAFPLWPLIATMAMQTVATMAAYSIPALAPMVARDIGVDGALIGMFVSVVYGVGIVSSLLAAGFIARYGAVRAAQFVLVCALGLVVICAQGTALSVALGAFALGIAYGLTAPVSTHLLVPRTPPAILNMVLSTRQIGVPLGGVLAATLMPPLALAVGWKSGLLLQAIPIIALILLLEIPRRDWDSAASRTSVSGQGVLGRSFALLRGNTAMQRLTFASFVYSGAQLAFVAFMTVHVTSRTGLGLVTAGWALATFQLAGVISRPILGWVADRFVDARLMLAIQGFVMAAAALFAANFAPGWPVWAIMTVAAVAGATASGFTGLAYAEYARLGGARRTEATGLGSAAMFFGVLVMPSLGSVAITATGSYLSAYGAIAALTTIAGAVLLLPVKDMRGG
ncbi:MFS transporter [Hyphomicrobium sp. CS1BSMeth3]|uniref:MFS transporter n=1 Tax=Hyphomicrobium sp. CS1BSMeth3 TaxID=1892844 RepID=UPI000930FA64|nr:MFS transporter [Hyphomicrobium sp. CS1BSMeth3]